MNNFKFFCESKDQAVPFALPAMRSYKQNILFLDLAKRIEKENKEKPKASNEEQKVLTSHSKTPLKCKVLNRNLKKSLEPIREKTSSVTEKSFKPKNPEIKKPQKIPVKAKEKTIEDSTKKQKNSSFMKPFSASVPIRTKVFSQNPSTRPTEIQRNDSESSNSLRMPPKTPEVMSRDIKNLAPEAEKKRKPATRSVSTRREKKRKMNIFDVEPLFFKMSDLSIVPLL